MSALLLRLVLLLSLCAPLWTGAQEQAVPTLQSPVTDLTGTLSAEQRQRLERLLLDFEQSKGSQIAVLLVPTTQPETIDQYSIRVVDQNKIGRAKIDDGILILVALQDRTARIEVGRGLEGAIPDVIADRIRRNIMNPHFQQGDFYGGLDAAVRALMRAIQGEDLPEAAPRSSGAEQEYESLFVLLLMFTLIGGGILGALFGRLFGSALTGGIAGTIAWFIAGSLFAGIAAAFLAFIFALTVGSGGGRALGHRGGPRGPWGGWPGGGWGGGGGFGGGSWGGGGGGFGGGGASGRW